MSLTAAFAPMASGFGSLASSALDYSNAEQNRSFQRSMDSTKYQRAMTDMKKAGLNPILAAGGIQTGAGSGSPMGKTENPINSALMAKNIMAQTDKLKAEAALVRNKTDMTDPIGTVMSTVEEFLGGPEKDLKGIAAGSYNSAKDAIRKTKVHHDSTVRKIREKIKSSTNSAKDWWNRGQRKPDIESKGFKE